MPRLPLLNPFVAPAAVCSTCGNTLPPITVRGAGGRIAGIKYVCKNEQTGCSYYVESDHRLSGQALPNPPQKEA